MTYQEIANEFGVTKAAIRQCEKRGLRKMRKGFLRLGITKADLRLFDRRSLISPLSEIAKEIKP